MDTLVKYSGPIDGRDMEEMDKILSDLEAAVDGLPFVFRIVPFDSPTICVYGAYGEAIGTIMWMTDGVGTDPKWEWWTICAPFAKLDKHGNSVRVGLARIINSYIDRKVGLI